jgi:hypothetical protein
LHSGNYFIDAVGLYDNFRAATRIAHGEAGAEDGLFKTGVSAAEYGARSVGLLHAISL